jgi:SagB-type dehydrogenase family enzyme
LKNNIKWKSRRNFLELIGAGVILSIVGLSWWMGNNVLKNKSVSSSNPETTTTSITQGSKYLLPLPKFASGVNVEESLDWRRSIREYKDEPITIENLSILLWSAQGVNELKYGFRTAPSAGGTYPLEVYAIISSRGVIIKGTEYLPAGSYKYDYGDHSITMIKDSDLREELAQASLNQEWVRIAPVNLTICADYEKTTKVYGERGNRYVHMEEGHVGQNLYLMAAALNLGTVVIGAFSDDQVKAVLGAQESEQPLYVQPIGVPVEPYKITEKEIADYYTKVRQSE